MGEGFLTYLAAGSPEPELPQLGRGRAKGGLFCLGLGARPGRTVRPA